MAKKSDKDWLGPPPTDGLKPLAIAKPGKRGWRWKKIPQSREDKLLRRRWEKKMAKADRKGEWGFKWDPKKELKKIRKRLKKGR